MAEGGSFLSAGVGEPQRRAFLELDRRLGEVQATIDALSPAHGDLTGLGDDDHPQYLTEARGDARYLQLSGGTLSGGLTVGGVISGNGSGLSSVDASALGGLGLSGGNTPPSGRQVVTSHTNGYTYLGWINTVSGATTSTISRIYASNDAFVRYVTPATFRSQIIDGNAISPSSVSATGDVSAQGNMYIGKNGGGDSNAYFYDDNSNTWRTLQWDDSVNDWRVEDNGGTMRTLYHSGNIPSYAASSHTHSYAATSHTHSYAATSHTHSYISTSSTNSSNLYIRGSSPTIYLRDTNNRSSMIHCNSNWFYVLRGNGNDSTTWTQTGGQWPLTVYLENNDVYVGGQFVVPAMAGTTSYNTVRWNSSNGHLMRYTSLAEFKQDIVGINDVLGALNERSLLHDLRPVLFHETEELGSSRGEYIAGFIAEEVHEVAPELTFYDQEGKLTSYAPDALIPHLVAEVQRLTGLVESLYAETHPDWVAPQPRPSDRGLPEKELFDLSAAHTAANPFVIPDPEVPEEPLEEEE